MQLYNTYNAYNKYNTYECKSYNMSQSLAAFHTNNTLVQLETTFKGEFVSVC